MLQKEIILNQFDPNSFLFIFTVVKKDAQSILLARQFDRKDLLSISLPNQELSGCQNPLLMSEHHEAAATKSHHLWLGTPQKSSHLQLAPPLPAKLLSHLKRAQNTAEIFDWLKWDKGCKYHVYVEQMMGKEVWGFTTIAILLSEAAKK